MFLSYFALIAPSKVNSLNEDWEFFLGCDNELYSMMKGDFLHEEEFLKIEAEKQ
jgi:hypothetical protein